MKVTSLTPYPRFSIFLILMLCFFGSLRAQKAIIPDRPLEKYRFFTDRDLYIAGEEILFTFFCSTTSEKQLHPISTVMYAELFSADKKVIGRGKFRLNQGYAQGRLIIPEETATGVYFIRAYTRYLRNFHPAVFPMHMCTIVNPDVPLPVNESSTDLRLLAVPADSSGAFLPSVRKEGLVTELRESESTIDYLVRFKQSSRMAAADKLFLTVSSSQFSTLHVDSTFSADTVVAFRIPGTILHPGINYFALHTPDGNLLDIQTCFLKKPSLPVTLKTDKLSYETREKVSLEISLPESRKDTAALSVSVVKKGSLNATGPGLQDPALFANPERPLSEAEHIFFNKELMDLKSIHPELMNNRRALTHLPEIRDVTISGVVQDRTTKNPVPGTRVLLSYLGEGTHIQLSETQNDGTFIFSLFPYMQKQDLFLCLAENPPDAEILINNDFTPEFPLLSPVQPNLDTTQRRLLEELLLNKQLKKLVHPSGTSTSDNMTSKRFGFGKADVSIRLEDYIDLPTMEVVLNEIVPYVKVRKRKGDYVLTILDPVTELLYENHLIIVDDIPLNDLNELMQLYPAQVEQIDVINRTYVIGDFTFRGILMVTTKTANFGGISLPPGAVFIDYEMITPEQPLPQSIPFQQSIEGFNQPDFRTVLYWDPALIIRDKSTLTFFTSDHRGTYEVVVRGRMKDGTVVSGRTEIVVE